MKKPRRDFITGVVGLVGVAFFYFQILDIKEPAKLLEPGPRLMPYVALIIIALSSIALIIRGWKDREKSEKPYFPQGGIKKITKSYILLWLYAIALSIFGFIISTPFATFAFIYDLKGESKVKVVTTVIISIVVTAVLYAMFVFGFQVRLPKGILFS